MAISRLRENVAEIVEGVLIERAAPEDQVEWDVTLGFDTDDCDDSEHQRGAVVLIYISLDCPESAAGEGRCKSVVQYGVPLRYYTPESIEEITHEVWDRIVVNRISEANGFPTPRLGEADWPEG